MKVKCVSEELSPEQEKMLGPTYFRDQAFPIAVGREYTVLGIYFVVGSNLRGTGTWVEVFGEYGRVGVAPLCLFEVTDARVSKFWECRTLANGGAVLQPSEFFQEYYFDDLMEGVPEVIESFERIRAELEGEFSA